MTVPVTCPPPSVDSAAPRKRRRRAPASGAPDDCFACSKRNVGCDRRRPYCSQCLEIGNECSGYKTQLTWGVGVASRGKLRGLSLPVAKSAPAARSPPRVRPRATASHMRSGSELGDINDDSDIEVKMEGDYPMSVASYTTYDFINMVPHSPSSMHHSGNSDWTMSFQEEQQVRPSHSSSSHQQHLRQSLHPLHTPMMRYEELNLAVSNGPLSAYSENDYSPMAHSFTAEEVPYLASPLPMYNSFSSSHDSPIEPPSSSYSRSHEQHGPTSCPDRFFSQSDVSSSIGSHRTLFEQSEIRRHAASPAACNMSDVSYDDEIMAHMSTSLSSEHFLGASHVSSNSYTRRADDDYAARAAAEGGLRALSTPEYLNVGLFPDISPRLSFYLNYYEKIICPITVAIDTPSNPYRHQILGLAAGSQSLQHAICALASCNLRMRRKRSLGQEHWRQPLEIEFQDPLSGGSLIHRSSGPSSASEGPLDDASVQEEYQHRSQAVALLNQQLSDPAKCKDDSVLATLLMLCHYRMCESGIAQFKTQFAGVKKLLGMRSSGPETGNWGWMESIFTFFDAITATVNDREAQLRGGYLDMIASHTPDFALENLTGCDGKLFKTIATLGRLNLLSQHRPVLDPNDYISYNDAAPPTPQPHAHLAGQALVDYYKIHSHKFDGNGFAHTLDDDDIMPSSSSSSASTSAVRSPTFNSSDEESRRTQFWQEWKETRLALQKWEFNPAQLVSSLGSIAPTPTQIRDFGFVSEAFRYAALLYTERLACPNLPASHLNVQNLVAQVLFYITSLDGGEGSDAMGKFLLWPLFVVGSECVSELHQSIVRGRCREIAARGGYLNNLAGLDVLEKVWSGGEGAEGANTFSRGPFRWTGSMDGVEGEYIMV